MDTIGFATVIASHASRNIARSALPDAPVVPDEPRPRHGPRAARPRAALARGLERLAHAVAPNPTCTPAT